MLANDNNGLLTLRRCGRRWRRGEERSDPNAKAAADRVASGMALRCRIDVGEHGSGTRTEE